MSQLNMWVRLLGALSIKSVCEIRTNAHFPRLESWGDSGLLRENAKESNFIETEQLSDFLIFWTALHARVNPLVIQLG